MKAWMLSAVAAALATGTAPAQATVFTVGSLAATCYQASLSHNVRSAVLNDCTRALDEEALSFDDQVATLVNRGIVRMNLGDQVGADRDFDAALAKNRNEPEAWLNKGLLRLRQNQPDAAVPFIERAMQARTIRPALAMYARGIANEQLGHVRQAYADLVRARDLAPGWSLPVRELRRYSVR